MPILIPRAVARFAIGRHRATMPQGGQGGNAHFHHAPARAAIDIGDNTHAAGIMFKISPIQAVSL